MNGIGRPCPHCGRARIWIVSDLDNRLAQCQACKGIVRIERTSEGIKVKSVGWPALENAPLWAFVLIETTPETEEIRGVYSELIEAQAEAPLLPDDPSFHRTLHWKRRGRGWWASTANGSVEIRTKSDYLGASGGTEPHDRDEIAGTS